MCAAALTRLPSLLQRLSTEQQKLWTEGLAAARAALGDTIFEEAWHSGAAMTSRQLLAGSYTGACSPE
jgi:hypothetical protein